MMEKSALAAVRVGGARPPPFSLLPSRTKWQCTLLLRGQIHFLYFICPLSRSVYTAADWRRSSFRHLVLLYFSATQVQILPATMLAIWVEAEGGDRFVYLKICRMTILLLLEFTIFFMWESGLLAVLKELVLVEFLVASCILGLLWGFAEAFLFIHLGNNFVSFVQMCSFFSHCRTSCKFKYKL